MATQRKINEGTIPKKDKRIKDLEHLVDWESGLECRGRWEKSKTNYGHVFYKAMLVNIATKNIRMLILISKGIAG